MIAEVFYDYTGKQLSYISNGGVLATTIIESDTQWNYSGVAVSYNFEYPSTQCTVHCGCTNVDCDIDTEVA